MENNTISNSSLKIMPPVALIQASNRAVLRAIRAKSAKVVRSHRNQPANERRDPPGVAKKWKNILISIILCACVSAGSLWVYDHYYATKVIGIKITEFTSKLREDFLSGRITEQQLDARLKYLEEVLGSQPNNTAILRSTAVVGQNIKMLDLSMGR